MNLQLFRSWAPSLEPVLQQHEECTLNDLWEKIASGGAQFWPGETCCAVTVISQDGDTRVLTYWLVGGELRAMLSLRPGIEAFARSWGCTTSRFYPARPAWDRLLAGLDFKDRGDGVMERAL